MSWHVKSACAAQASRGCESSSAMALQSRPQAQFGSGVVGAADLLVLRRTKKREQRGVPGNFGSGHVAVTLSVCLVHHTDVSLNLNSVTSEVAVDLLTLDSAVRRVLSLSNSTDDVPRVVRALSREGEAADSVRPYTPALPKQLTTRTRRASLVSS